VNKFLSNFILITSALILSFSFAFYLSQQTKKTINQEPRGPVFLKTESGELKYAQGSCTSDNECFQSGCSSEICTSSKVITTCELKEDYPDPEKYQCGCLENLCVWYEK